MSDFTIKDSGKRQEFSTGARRDSSEDKPRYDLLPYEALYQWAMQLTEGAKKYGDRNWEKGIPLSRHVQSALRHMIQLAAGHTDENHAAAVMANVGFYIQTKKWVEDGTLPQELGDHPVSRPDSFWHAATNGTLKTPVTPASENGRRERNGVSLVAGEPDGDDLEAWLRFWLSRGPCDVGLLHDRARFLGILTDKSFEFWQQTILKISLKVLGRDAGPGKGRNVYWVLTDKVDFYKTSDPSRPFHLAEGVTPVEIPVPRIKREKIPGYAGETASLWDAATKGTLKSPVTPASKSGRRERNGVPLVDGEPWGDNLEAWLKFWLSKGPCDAARLEDRARALGVLDGKLVEYWMDLLFQIGLRALGRDAGPGKGRNIYWVLDDLAHLYENSDPSRRFDLSDRAVTVKIPVPVKNETPAPSC